ncbi:MAG: hypothetical protein JST54_11385 [Deltaproteobacteria bacterium]|nr:hypothetical protein [Deltaproteobacteria bacterium]
MFAPVVLPVPLAPLAPTPPEVVPVEPAVDEPHAAVANNRDASSAFRAGRGMR